jgi:hypothetical protein
VYGGAIKILLQNEANAVSDAAAFVKKWVNDMMDNKVSLNQLMLTKSLRSEYKMATPPAHKVLANRITERDPGNAPASGDRLSFVYFKQPPGAKNVSQGDRVETPAFMKAHGLKPDPEYYIEHQLENPIGQLFSILVDQLPDARPPIQGWSADPAMQAAERELYAREYLFRGAKEKKTNTLMNMWGVALANATPVAKSVSSRTRAATSAANAKAAKGQSRIDELFADRMLVSELQKGRKKKGSE